MSQDVPAPTQPFVVSVGQKKVSPITQSALPEGVVVIRDLPLAAALIVNGKHLIEIQVDYRMYPYRGDFLFENDGEVDRLVSDFYGNCLFVDARAFTREMRELKSSVMGSSPRNE